MDNRIKAGQALERIKAGLANFKLSRCLFHDKDNGLKNLNMGRSSSCLRNGFTWHLIDIEGYQNKQRFRQTIVATEVPNIKFPPFYLRNETIWDLDLLGRAEKSDFLNCPSFTARFYLTGPDKEALCNFFTADILAQIEQSDKIDIAEGCESIFIYYRQDFLIEPEVSGLFLDQAFTLLQHCLPPSQDNILISTS
ncbi:MAG: hypothetical protein AB2L14_10605 [Candidatus Xenobiia bacterium LiM19]